MADDLRVRVIAEADEASSAKRINEQLPTISKQLEKVKVGLELDNNSVSSGVNDISKQVQAATKSKASRIVIPVEIGIEADTLKRKLALQADTLKKSIGKIGAPLDWSKFDSEFSRNSIEGFRQASKELAILKEQYRNFDAGIAKVLPRDAIENLNKYISDTSVKTEELRTKFQSLRNGVPTEAISQFEKLSTLQKEMASIPTTDVEARSKKYNETAAVIDNLNRSFKTLFNTQKQADQSVVFDTTEKRAQKLLQTVENLKVKYGAFLGDRNLRTQYNQLYDEVKVAKTAKEQANVNAQIGKFEQVLISAGKNQRSFGAEMSNNIKKMGNWMLLGGMMASLFRGIRGVFTNVTDLDTALVNIQMATGDTEEEAGKLMETYSDLAKELGATTQEVAASASDWLRQGKSIADTNTLIRNSMILSKVGGIEAAAATEYLTTATKGYNVSVADSIGIVDKLSAVDMQAAVSAGGLAEGMAQVANGANMAGVSMDKLLGYLAVVGETSGESLSAVGQAFSTIFARMGNIKLARLDDYQNNGEDLSNVETVLDGLGIKLRDTDKQFRNFGEVLDEIASKWTTFSDVDQRALASSIASKNHYEEFLILMQNYSKATEYATVAMNSNGTATEKFANYQNSVVAKQKEMTAAFEQFSNAILDSELIKGTYDAGTGILGFLTQAIDLLGAFPTLATAAMGAMSFKLPNIFEKTSGGIGLSEATRELFAKREPYKVLDDTQANAVFFDFAKATQSGAVALRDFNAQTKDPGIKKYLSTLQNGVGNLDEYQRYIGFANQALAQMSIKGKIAAAGMKALSVATSMAISMGVSLLIDFVITQISNLINAQDIAIQKAQEISSAWDENAQSLSKMSKAIGDVSGDFDKLSKGVNSFGENVSLSADEYDRYKEIANSLAEIFPNTVAGWSNENDAILKTTTSLQTLNEEYKKALQLQNERILSGAGDVFEGFKASVAKKRPDLNSALDLQNILTDPNLTDVTGQDKLNELKRRLPGYGNVSPILDAIGLSDASFAELKKNGKLVSAYLNTLRADLNNGTKDIKTALLSDLNTDETFTALDKNVQQIITSIVSGLDYAFIDQSSSLSDLYNYISTNIVDAVSDPRISDAITKTLSMQDAMKNNEVSVQQFLTQYSQLQSSLWPSSTNKGLDAAGIMGVSSLFDTESIRTMVEYAKNLLQTEYDFMASSLNLEDLKIAYKLENVGEMSFDELKGAIANAKKTAAAEVVVNFDDVVKEYGNKLDRADYKKSAAQSVIDTKTQSGATIVADDYANAIEAGNDKILVLIEKRNKLSESLSKAMESGTVKDGTEEWHKQTGEIEKTNLAIDEENRYIASLSKSISEIPYNELEDKYARIKASRDSAQSSVDLRAKSGGPQLATDYKYLASLSSQMSIVLTAQSDQIKEQLKLIPIGSTLYNDYLLKLKEIETEINTLAAEQVGYNNAVSDLSVSAIDNQISEMKRAQQGVQSEIDIGAAKGQTQFSAQYSSLIDYSNQLVSLYGEQNVLYTEQLSKLSKTSEQYQEVSEKIAANKQAIADATVKQEEWKQEVQKTKSAYDKWIESKDSKESGDMYRGVADAISEVNKLIKDGEVGTQKYKAGLELLVPDSAKKSLKTVKDYLASIKGYFTEGPQGARKFAADLAKTAPNLASYDSKTGNFDLFTKDAGQIAKAMNLSEDVVRAMVGRLNELIQSGPQIELNPPKPVDLEYNDLGTKQIEDLNAKELKDKTATLKYKVAGVVGGVASMLGLSKGTKSAPGGPAFVGEGEGALKGTELIYNKKKRRFWFATKPTITNLDKGDIVYNAKQTKALLKSGGSLAGGNAYADGTDGTYTPLTIRNIGKNTSKGKSSDGSAAFLKTLEDWFDWIPRAIDIAAKATEKFKKLVDSAVGYINKNRALVDVSASLQNEIQKNQQALAVYERAASDVASRTRLSADIVRKIQEGSPEIEVINDKNLKAKIDAYQQWWDKAQDVKSALTELQEQEKELAKQRLDNITQDFENQTNRIDARISKGQSSIDKKIAIGQQVTESDYLPSISATIAKLDVLRKQREAFDKEFISLVTSGVIQKDSDAWNEYAGQLENLDETINQTEIDIQGLKDTSNQVQITGIEYETAALEQQNRARQNAIDLKASQGKDATGNDFISLINTSSGIIANYERINILLEAQKAGLYPLSEKYQEIQDKINANRDSINEAKINQEQWNDSIKDIQIKSLQDQKEELQKVNEAEQKRLALQQAQEDLSRAQQRRIRILKDGQFVYEADQKAITDAQNKLDDLRSQKQLDKLDELIDAVEESKKTDNIYATDSDGKVTAFANGGTVKKTGLALVHKGEPILSNEMIAKLNNTSLGDMMFGTLSGTTMKSYVPAVNKSGSLGSMSNQFVLTVNKGDDFEFKLHELLTQAELKIKQEVYTN